MSNNQNKSKEHDITTICKCHLIYISLSPPHLLLSLLLKNACGWPVKSAVDATNPWTCSLGRGGRNHRVSTPGEVTTPTFNPHRLGHDYHWFLIPYWGKNIFDRYMYIIYVYYSLVYSFRLILTFPAPPFPQKKQNHTIFNIRSCSRCQFWNDETHDLSIHFFFENPIFFVNKKTAVEPVTPKKTLKTNKVQTWKQHN